MYCNILSLCVGDIVELNNTLFRVVSINVLDLYFIVSSLESDTFFYVYETNQIKLYCREQTLF